jgi:hypothetical protein
VLRRIFGQKKDEMIEDWRQLHNDELHNLYFSPNIIRMIKSRRMKWAGYISRMGAKRNSYRVDWIDLAQDTDQWRGVVKHGNESSGSIKCWEILGYLSDWWLLNKDSSP